MKRTLLFFAIAALAAPVAAFAKGPSAATVDGPGAPGGISFKGFRSAGALAGTAGFFPAAFKWRPDPMLDRRPAGDLGPRYTITWDVPAPNNESLKVEQDVYPYAKPRPVTYTEPGQEIFATPGGTRGGWFRANARLKQMLVAAGLPERAPSSATDRSSALDLIMPSCAVFFFAVLLLRRRRPTAKMAGSPD